MVIVVRHGRTNMNENGKEKSRGWLPIPLTLEGMKEARETAESLEEVEDVDHIFTSDLPRVIQSANEIGQVLSMELEPVEELRDWNTGELTGQEIKKILPELHRYMDDPNKKIPEGESFQSFLDRTVPFLTEKVEGDELSILVTHNRVITLLMALAKTKGEYPSIEVMKKKGPIDPSGILIIKADWSVPFMTKKRAE